MNSARALACVMVLSAICLTVGGVASEQLPTYVIKRAAGEITIDGVLDEPDWQAAESVGDFVFPWWTAGEKEQTVAKMLWDETYFYVSFLCYDKYIWSEYTEKDDPVYKDDAVEIFISPDPDSVTNNYDFEINSIAVLYDQSRIPNNNSDRTWDAVGVKLAHQREGTLNDDSDVDEWWTMEVAIPFSNFSALAKNTPPKDGDEWRLNLNRCGGKTNQQYSQWSSSETVKPNFHVPERFGVVLFSDEKVEIKTLVPSERWGKVKSSLKGSGANAADPIERGYDRTSLEERMAKVEGALEQIADRLNHLEAEMREIRAEMRDIRAEMRDIRADMSSQFKWTVGLLMGMWVTIIGALASLIAITKKG